MMWTILIASTLAVAQAAAQVSNNNTCNGFSELCNRPLNQILYPGTHNSYALTNTAGIPPVAANQNSRWSIEKQLTAGVRLINLDLWRARESNELRLCHGGCNFLDAGLASDSVRVLSTFVNANPRDFIFVIIENKATATTAEITSLFRELIPFVHIPASQSAENWPTLGFLLDSNKRVLIFSDLGTTNEPEDAWLLSANAFISESDYKAFRIEDFSCPARSSVPKPFNLVYHMLSISLLGSSEIYIPNYNAAGVTNSAASVRAHLSKCSVTTGFLLVDFGETGDWIQAVGAVNGVLIDNPSTKTSDGYTLYAPMPLVITSIMFLYSC